MLLKPFLQRLADNPSKSPFVLLTVFDDSLVIFVVKGNANFDGVFFPMGISCATY